MYVYHIFLAVNIVTFVMYLSASAGEEGKQPLRHEMRQVLAKLIVTCHLHFMSGYAQMTTH